jgi:hypothetical protein
MTTMTTSILSSLDKVFNINYLEQNNTSLAKALLMFYVFVASNYTKDLYSKQLKEFFEENRLAQHLVGFITMLILINMIAGVTETGKIFVYSLLAYFWFILTTKLDIHWNVVIILMLLGGFLYENRLNEKEELLSKDTSLTKSEKETIVLKNNRHRTYIVASILVVTVVGIGMYAEKKDVQYGGGFDPIRFFLY